MSAALPWWSAFPALRDIRDAGCRAALEQAREVAIPPGTSLFQPGDACRDFLFVVEGTVRVEKVAENGREIVLYRVGRGETCLLTTSCLIARERYPAKGVTETEVRAAALPQDAFNEALALSPEFRSFVFASFGARLADLMTLVEALIFGRGDARLARRLLELAGSSGDVAATHQQLAAELGTAREVVSRFLKEFERRGYVRLARGRVQITDRAALDELAEAV